MHSVPAPVPGLFSFLMTARDAEAFVGEAVASLLAQTDPHLEVIAVDDGSTDQTVQVLEGHTDPRVRVFRLPPVGRAAALAEAARRARGEYLAILDADDIALPRRVEVQRAYLARHPEVALVGCRAIEFAGAAECVRPAPTGPAAVRRALGMYNPFHFSSVALRRSAYDEAGGFREKDGWACDLSLLIRVAARRPVDILPEPLVRYRRHPGQATASAAWDRSQRRRSARMKLWGAWQLGLPWYLWVFPLFNYSYSCLPPALRPRRVKDWVRARLARGRIRKSSPGTNEAA